MILEGKNQQLSNLMKREKFKKGVGKNER